jgi:hypothetical protein
MLVHGWQVLGWSNFNFWGDMIEKLTYISADKFKSQTKQLFNTPSSDPNNPGWLIPTDKIGPLGPYYSSDGKLVYISNYSYSSDGYKWGTHSDIKGYASCLASEIQTIKNRESINKIDIVAHSMGGLVARCFDQQCVSGGPL